MTMPTIEEMRALTPRKIVTEFVCPPIPYRSVDWAAHFDDVGEDSPVGFGETEWDAIADLLSEAELLTDGGEA
jgi:hypothetical protein